MTAERKRKLPDRRFAFWRAGGFLLSMLLPPFPCHPLALARKWLGKGPLERQHLPRTGSRVDVSHGRCRPDHEP